MKILNKAERVIRKQYITVEVEGKCYKVYDVNGTIRIFEMFEDDSYAYGYRTEEIHGSIGKLTGHTRQKFREMVEEFINPDEEEEIEEMEEEIDESDCPF